MKNNQVFSETEGSPRLPSASFARVDSILDRHRAVSFFRELPPAPEEFAATAYVTAAEAGAYADRGHPFPISGDLTARLLDMAAEARA